MAQWADVARLSRRRGTHTHLPRVLCPAKRGGEWTLTHGCGYLMVRKIVRLGLSPERFCCSYWVHKGHCTCCTVSVCKKGVLFKLSEVTTETFAFLCTCEYISCIICAWATRARFDLLCMTFQFVATAFIASPLRQSCDFFLQSWQNFHHIWQISAQLSPYLVPTGIQVHRQQSHVWMLALILQSETMTTTITYQGSKSMCKLLQWLVQQAETTVSVVFCFAQLL